MSDNSLQHPQEELLQAGILDILDIRLHIANAIDQLLEACRAVCVVCILSISEVAGRGREAL